VERLHALGKWLAVNGEAIYGTGPTLMGAEDGAFSTTEKDKNGKPKFVSAFDWRSTTAKDKVYIEVFHWPAGGLHLEKLPRKVTGAYLLADAAKRPLAFTQTAAGVDVKLPAAALDPVATVVVLTTAAR